MVKSRHEQLANIEEQIQWIQGDIARTNSTLSSGISDSYYRGELAKSLSKRRNEIEELIAEREVTMSQTDAEWEAEKRHKIEQCNAEIINLNDRRK